MEGTASVETIAAHPKRQDWCPRLALAGGVGFVVLLVGAGFLAPSPPAPTAPAGDLAAWLVAHRDVALTQVYLRGLAALLLLIFVGGAVDMVRRARGRAGLAGHLARGGAGLFAALLLLSNVATATAIGIADRGGEPGIVAALDALGATMRQLNGLSAALLSGALSVALLRARAVPRWAGWLGLAAVPAFLIGSAGFPGTPLEPLNLLAFPFVLLWPLALALALLWRTGREGTGGGATDKAAG